jgi:pilus assembly protein CpaB
MSTEPKVARTEAQAKARRALLWSLACGLLSAALAGWFLRRYEQEVSGGERVTILRAQQPIERGVVLSDDMLLEATVPASYLEARAVRAADRGKVRGLRTASSLETQDALLWSDLAVSQEHRDLSALIQPGNRAVSIHASLGQDGTAGTQMVRPGDYVDVLATLQPRAEAFDDRNNKLVAVLLLQRVMVLAVGAVTDPQLLRGDAAGDESRLRDLGQLTLSLKVEEAQLLALARERGKLSVILRQPDDTRIVEGAPEMPVSNLFDSGFRNDLQRRRSPDLRPIRLVTSTNSP